MDEITLNAIRQKFRKAEGPRVGRARAEFAKAQRSVNRTSDHYTGRSAQMNVRCTPGFKDEMRKAAAEFGFPSLGEFVAEVLSEYVAKRRAAKP
jgi:hypothetical protein